MFNRLFPLCLILIAALFLLASPVPTLALDDVPTGDVSPVNIVVSDAAPVLEVPTYEDVRDSFASLLIALLAGVAASPLTSAIVAAVKRLPVKLIQKTSGAAINLIVSALLVGTTWLAGVLGFSVQLDTVFKLILAVAPILLGTGINAKASAGYYNNVVNGVPFLGTPRRGAISAGSATVVVAEV